MTADAVEKDTQSCITLSKWERKSESGEESASKETTARSKRENRGRMREGDGYRMR